MGHIAIVNSDTLENVKNTGYVSIIASKDGDFLLKTISDQFADLLNVKKGDKIFFWLIANKKLKTQNLGFVGYAVANGNAIFVKNDEFPYKIPISEINTYSNPLSEREALSLNREKKLWNIIGKKSLGRGRGLLHQTPFEDDILLNLLKNKSGEPEKNKITSIPYECCQIEILLGKSSLTKGEFNKDNDNKLIKNWDINTFPFISENIFAYEKTLEAYLIQKLRDNDMNFLNILRSKIGCNRWEIVWFGNYLAYGVMGGNIDLVIILKLGNKFKVLVIELKNEKLNYEKTLDVIDQVNEYEIEMKETFVSFIEKENLETVKIVITPSHSFEAETDDIIFFDYSVIQGDFIIQ
jgi:hypothetical protein